MSTPVLLYETADALGAALAGDVLAAATLAHRQRRPMLLGCPGGRSLRTTYAALGRLAAERQADLSHLVIVMMDEYVQPQGAGFLPCPPAAHYSCTRFAHTEIRGVLNCWLAPERRVRPDNVWVPDPRDPAGYDRRLEAAGGLDLFLLASGASDGHVAFNPPGTPLDTGTRVVALAESTRRDNLATFPQFRSLEEVPRHGVSVGLGTIVRLSRAVSLVIHGAHKRAAAQRLLACRGFDPGWPASVVHLCANPRILLDKAAAAT